MKTLALILSLSAVFLFEFDAHSKDPPARLYAAGIPETGFLTLKSGAYSLVIDAASGWTIEEMSYGQHLFGLKNGHYGTVLTPKGGKWWGTGHAEGGREVVHSIQISVDGKMADLKMDQTYSGKTVKLIKDSTIWKFKVHAEITVTDKHIYERTQMQALEDCDTDVMYYFMHIFPTTTTQWMAQLPDGETEVGPLKHSGNHQVKKDTQWVAQYDPSTQMAYLCYTPKVITGSDSASMIWDLDRYHKYYLRQNKGQKFRKGDRLDYTALIKVVPNENENWDGTKAAAVELMREFPVKK